MADASAWVGAGTAAAVSDRAAAAWARILEKPTVIRIKRGNTTLAGQTVRLEYSNSQSNAEAVGGAGMSSMQQAVVFGIRGHETEADTNIRRDDRFTADGLQFRVVSVIWQTGEIQAKCEVQG